MLRSITKIALLLLFISLLAACAQPAPTPTPLPTAAPTVEGASAAGAPVAGQRTFVIVPAESKASYLVDEEFFAGALAKLGIAAGLVDVVGSTQEIEGRLTLNLDDLSAPLGENTFTVKMNTFTTDQRDRDKWIRENGPRFNDYPLATFTATSIEGAPAAYNEGEEVSFKLSGDLTIREITRPVTFDVTATLRGDTLTGVATTRLKMSDFGIEPPNFANTLTVADEFGIEVQITAKEQ
ncbi:MAG TPA: YceI family protein [Chloroflexi bacterium]|nr:YceI family protein [Chloroflexota bacterium]